MFSRLESYKHHDPQPRINYPHFAWPVWRIVFQVGINYTPGHYFRRYSIFISNRSRPKSICSRSPFQIEAIGKTDRFTNNCFYLNGSWYWRGIFPVKYHEIPQKHVSLPTPTPFFHPMTPVWDRSPADWGWPQSSKQHKFEFEESRIAKLYIYIYIHTYICIPNSLLSIRPPGGQPRFTV